MGRGDSARRRWLVHDAHPSRHTHHPSIPLTESLSSLGAAPGAVASAAVSRRVSGATRGFTYHVCTPSRKGKEKKADRPASSHTAGYAGLCNTTLARDRGRSVRSCASSDWPPVVMQPGIGQQEGQNRREIYMRKYILRCQFVHSWHRVMELPIHSYLFALAREPAPLLLSPTR